MHWLAQAPANIALIKYMGKQESGSNLPDNASLSYTMDNFITTVRIEVQEGNKDSWEALALNGCGDFQLSATAQQRFLDHLARIKELYGYSGALLIQSNNNFPHSSGLASSASSFAALTKCAVLALSALTQRPILSNLQQAQLSRQGSGSSCRSFFSPWALWQEDEVGEVELPYQKLFHQVVVVDNQEKKVSSSQAHQRVKTSPKYAMRKQKAEQHLHNLLQAMSKQDWTQAYKICWDEFQDMHELFSTCAQPFSYITEQSQDVLDKVQALWQQHKDGPIVTMDAGPNVHLLYRLDQMDLAQQFQHNYLAGNYEVL